MNNKDIQVAVFKEVVRILCFITYYIALIALGVLLIVGSVWLSYWGIFTALPEIRNGRLIILLITCIIGSFMLAAMIGVYLVKPLFKFSKDTKDTRVEVTEKECPALFAMIREVSQSTKCRMPKHVYLSPEVNACVFFNTSFWSIFFPIRKNLEIGLGLFDGTSTEEVKAIIAHEFGHFSQKSMKIGSTVYVTNTVLYNLIYSKDAWDRDLEEWCEAESSVIQLFGFMTMGLTALIKRMSIFVYKFVQKGFLKLSRFMEYDADIIACHCVGKDVFISALCKIDILSKSDMVFRKSISALMDRKEIVNNYFDAKRAAISLLAIENNRPIEFNKLLEHSTSVNPVKSRISIENVWASHPTLEDRIANVSNDKCSTLSKDAVASSWELIPGEIADKISKHIINIIKQNVGEEFSVLSNEEYSNWLVSKYKSDSIDVRLRPFFNHRMIELDLDKLPNNILNESPLNEASALKIAEFNMALDDWNLLNRIKNREFNVREVQIDGFVYKRKKLPIDKFERELDKLHRQTVNIYSNIYSYILNNLNKESKESFEFLFQSLFYAQHIETRLLPTFHNNRNFLLEEYSSLTSKERGQYHALCDKFIHYEFQLKKLIADINLLWLADMMHTDQFTNYLRGYLEKEHNSTTDIDKPIVSEMFQLVDDLSYVINNIYSNCLKHLCDITISAIYTQDKKDEEVLRVH